RRRDLPSFPTRRSSDLDMGAQMRRILEAAGQQAPQVKPALEINPAHALLQRIAATEDGADFDDLSLLLFEQATLAEGGQLSEPADRKSTRLNSSHVKSS